MTDTLNTPEPADKSTDEPAATQPVLPADSSPPWQSREGSAKGSADGSSDEGDAPEDDSDYGSFDTDEYDDDDDTDDLKHHRRQDIGIRVMQIVLVLLVLVLVFIIGAAFGEQRQKNRTLSRADAQVLASVPDARRVADALGVPKMVLGDVFTGINTPQTFDVNGAGACDMSVTGPTPRTSVFTTYNASDRGDGTTVDSATFHVYSMNSEEDASEVASTVTVTAQECRNDVPQREVVDGSVLHALKVGNPVVADVRWVSRHDRSACAYLTGYATTAAYTITVCGTSDKGMSDAALTLAGELNNSLLRPLPYVPARR